MSKLTPREELMRLQKKIFRRNDGFIKSQSAVIDSGFETYEREYKGGVRSYKSVSKIEDLIKEVIKSDIIYIGDYHTNPQSQRSLLRLLKILIKKVPNLGLGLELVLKRHQKSLEAYLSEKLSEEGFLKKINFKKLWYFDLWDNFKPIFEFSKYHKIPMFGIEWCVSLSCSLKKRDEETAKIIANIVHKNPGMKFIIFVGDLHIAPKHLPTEVEKCLRQKKLKKKSLNIYQNSEEIYWKLAKKGLEDKVEIVKVNKNSFCIQNTPPIVWQQSYLNWLEHEGGEIDYADAKSHFMDITKRIAKFLNIKLPATSDDIEIFTCGDLSFLSRLNRDKFFDKKELGIIKKQILASESYTIPHKKIVYLANLSLNHAAEEASHYLRYLAAGQEFPRRIVDAFYMNILHEALGFFGSKIINHKRKTMHEKDYKQLLAYLKKSKLVKERALQFEMASLIVEHKRLEKYKEPISYQRYMKEHPEIFFGVTHGLGYILGDQLYYALLNHKIKKDQIRDLFQDPFVYDGEPFETYLKLIQKMKGVKIPKRV